MGACHYGGAAFFYPGVAEKIEQCFGKQFYILPSSTAELILAPYSSSPTVGELKSLVRSVNADPAVVRPEVKLGDFVMLYSGGTIFEV